MVEYTAPGIDKPVCMIDVATGDKYWYHYNGSGSVVALSKYDTQAQQAEIVERYKYDEFGNTTVTLNGNTGNPYRCTASGIYDKRLFPSIITFFHPPLLFIETAKSRQIHKLLRLKVFAASSH